MNRVRTYSYTRSVNRPCAGGAVFSLVTYFVIDNATKSDEGLYSVTIVTRSYEEKREFMVNIGKLNILISIKVIDSCY